MTEPGWLPDPSGRHEMRWHDGSSFTDQVADAGTRSTDAGPAAATAPAPTPAPAPRVPDPHLPLEVTGRASRVPLILAGIGALLVVVALLALLSRGGNSGEGTFDGEVATGVESSHTVTVSAGSVLVVEVRPSEDLDAIVELDLQGEDRRRVIDLYADSALGGADLLLRRDVGFDGEEEHLFLAVPFDIEVDVAVSGFDGSEGDYEIGIDVVDLEIDEDASVEVLLDAVLAADDVPRAVRAELEALLLTTD